MSANPTSGEIRRRFIEFFVNKQAHRFYASSPVVPHDDPTLLFANAGMNQFKPAFLGQVTQGSPLSGLTRAVNSQKCIRAGGKHNDLEDVGKDTYHHTFFEMLGNWSFGDYFKKEAIAWAWDLLTNVWGMDKSRLHATVFGGDASDGLAADEEAAELWRTQTDIDPSHIHLGSKKDNFWEMGDSGPCGPCSEVHIDLTPDKSGAKLINADDARVIEIWNLVFIQFNRDASGKLTPLPAKHVDTGMGFERVCAVLQGKTSNYDTDVFKPLFDAIRKVTGAAAYGGRMDSSPQGKADMAYRVIADHIRCLTFAITDGAVPSNEGRGYVLRRILRRAVRHGWQTLNVKEPFLHRLVPAVVAAMSEAFPELKQETQNVIDVIKDEEESFARTLDRGIALFEAAAADAIGREYARSHGLTKVAQTTAFFSENDEDPPPVGSKYSLTFKTHSGETIRKRLPPDPIDFIKAECKTVPCIPDKAAFMLHDTYGFPLDLTQVMAEERGMTVDVAGFERLMEEAREKARSGGGSVNNTQALVEAVQREQPGATVFLGYDLIETKIETYCTLYKVTDAGCECAEMVNPGDEVAVVVGQTPFYAEAGGQVGDTGTITTPAGEIRIHNTVKIGDVYFHLGVVESGTHRSEKAVQLHLKVDRDRRRKIMANHTGTHMLNRALRDTLGDHVQQKGSLVDDQKLRFDFAHNAPITPEQIDKIENMVNTDITADMAVYAEEADQEQALKINSLRAVFGEKYPPRVRVVSIGVPVADLLAKPDNGAWQGYSIEFCGGTHLAKTGDAEGLVVVSEEAVSKGVRRLTAMTSQAAHRATAQGQKLLARVESMRSSEPDKLQAGIAQISGEMESTPLPLLAKAQLRGRITELQATLKEHAKQQSKQSAGAAVEAARKIADEAQGDVIVASLDDADANALRTAMDVIRKKKPDAALLLGGIAGDKVAFIASVPKPLIDKGLKAGDWVREVAKVAGGGGGGRPDMAQAGGKDPAKLNDALETGRAFAKSKLQP